MTRASLVLDLATSASQAVALLLGLAACGGLAVALLHVALAFSLPLCRFCGAPEWVLAAGAPLRVAVTLAAAAVFGAFGAVPLLALDSERRWPHVWLAPIGALYTLRGLALVPEMLALAGLIRLDGAVAPQEAALSTLSLLIGVLYLSASLALRRLRL